MARPRTSINNLRSAPTQRRSKSYEDQLREAHSRVRMARGQAQAEMENRGAQRAGRTASNLREANSRVRMAQGQAQGAMVDRGAQRLGRTARNLNLREAAQRRLGGRYGRS